MSATRFVEGEPLGTFEYHGTRQDDPNDIYPHEHRRELRGNRVFWAWLAHDDSRAVNTRNILIAADGRSYVRHYMYDFGATLGSATRFAEPATNNHETYLDKGAQLQSPGDARPRRPKYLRGHAPIGPPAAGAFDSTSFEPGCGSRTTRIRHSPTCGRTMRSGGRGWCHGSRTPRFGRSSIRRSSTILRQASTSRVC